MYLCQKYARMNLKDIGAYFGVGQSGTPRPLHGLFFDVCAGMALVDKPFGEAPASSEKSFVLR
jgi:hypothetical protein